MSRCFRELHATVKPVRRGQQLCSEAFSIRHTCVSRTLILVTKQHHLSYINKCIRAISAADTQGARHMTCTIRSQAVYPAAVSSREPLNAWFQVIERRRQCSPHELRHQAPHTGIPSGNQLSSNAHGWEYCIDPVERAAAILRVVVEEICGCHVHCMRLCNQPADTPHLWATRNRHACSAKVSAVH